MQLSWHTRGTLKLITAQTTSICAIGPRCHSAPWLLHRPPHREQMNCWCCQQEKQVIVIFHARIIQVESGGVFLPPGCVLQIKKKKKVCKRVLTSPGINHISLSLSRPAVLLIEQKDELLTSSTGLVQRHCGHLDAKWHAVFPRISEFNGFISSHFWVSYFIFFFYQTCLHIYFPLSVWKLRDSRGATMTRKILNPHHNVPFKWTMNS